ncbi:helix-turn-helix transcriptional regulator [Aquimarina sp. U1-2]|uniref:helix-turn-helix domain-containing protein n=1 Tax=Aquimarina sp. U1-2 TaxID=2823141 RepID=UPI001AEC9577|nr:helix-turn-helix transcriptional regulator [Aquimarina sp. U1-2]MBP2831093.1 helix-turn-helix transcriptional regulator [Aquimarina sp. U1-2]
MNLYHNIKDLLQDWNISTTASSEELHILRIEDHFKNEPFKFGPYQQDFFELSFGYGHDVNMKIGNTDFNALDNVLSFTTPYQIASWEINGFNPDSIGFMVLFKYDILGTAKNKMEFHQRYPFLNLHATPVLFLTEKQQETIINLMQNLLFEFKNNPNNQIIIRSYLTIILEKVKEFYSDAGTKGNFLNRAQEITFLFENVIKAQTNYKLKIADYARLLNVSSAYLSESVKKASHRTAHAIIQEYLILKAQSLLNQTNKTITIIAEELGFEESSNFVKYFKKAVGTTPHKYRR